jgi:hypothetical protein
MVAAVVPLGQVSKLIELLASLKPAAYHRLYKEPRVMHLFLL